MSVDARLHPRARAAIRVEFQFGGTRAEGVTNDVSEGGIYLETDVAAEPGTRIYLRLFLPGDESAPPLEMVGVVRRRSERPSEHGAVGLGVRFEIAHARARVALGEFIAAITRDPSAPRESMLPARPALESSPDERAPSEGSAGIWVWGLGLALVVLAVLRLWL